ncbi:hypothetical protein DDE82_004117 [Stemphylium lycopersici]|uniref:Uncharacterized protein n=1 Tax=Stemphylium lycopersici TaxID=183478 RepID=A0A364NG17_STELY|nr:hypothetical protein TW65_03765 [Stemphylium lycopersici]RAR05099.1 hypothetical protein DDE82_004117 [Stemphylium lycopersici]RAR16275.1 hypothetical protein DDE83_000403 [Stemphylium lycopersici]
MSALLSLAAASPNALARRENQATTQAIQFAALQADCDIFKCASVVASAACIAASIALGPAGVASALGCTAGGAASICPCAPCIDALNNFLVDNGVCSDE